ncbi:MAG: hypothetical protein MOGMAGMI_00280 [Candidatus Omnitrophica bacterium]|nr:hypothetical protein [Candidatus Omnitrophota bacterium]
MAIKKSFAGASIRKPGAYSTTKVDNSSGAALESNDTIFLVGEALEGAPGSIEGIQLFSASQIDQLISKYRKGPLVDAALAVTRPSRTPGVNGAGRILIYKTNATTQASLTLENSLSQDIIILKDRQWGAAGNDLSVTIANGTTATQKEIQVSRLGGTVEILGENEGLSAISIQYTGDATTASLAISGATKAAKTLAVTLAGDQTDGSLNLSIPLTNYTLKTLVDFINTQVGYTASLVTIKYAAKPAVELDILAATSILVSVNLYRLQEEIVELINLTSTRIEAELTTIPAAGLPANITDIFLTGGAQGASLNSDFSTGLAASLAEDYNVVLPCISRDAATDIADALQGFTDAASTYTISSVIAATESHLRLRGQVKNRKESQGFVGFRNSTKAAAYTQAQTLSSELVQLCIQDVFVVNELGSLEWKHPHIQAALFAGIRLGTPVGEPLTFKRINALGIGHFVNAATGLEAGDFNAALDVDQAIDAGITFCEKFSGGFRIVVDNTTYGADESFVFNRGSVVEAAQFVARDLRKLAEDVFVGRKVSNGAARSIKSVLRARLIELNADDVNIITSSLEAPQGFIEETFVVEIEGNTAKVQVHIKPVQGLDFVFITFTLGDIRQAA